MIRGARVAAACLTLVGLAHAAQGPSPTGVFRSEPARDTSLVADLDHIFEDPVLAHALLTARVESLSDGHLLYERNADTLVMPASNMKIVTVAVAAATLGWQYQYETRLETTGTVTDGTLDGDLIVMGTGDPSIGSPDDGHAGLFLEWADALRATGIRRIDGRLIGDDDAFDDDGLGFGWSWDDLAYGYAAPVGALNYNENAAVLRITPGANEGNRAVVRVGPPGHMLEVRDEVTTGAPGSPTSVTLERFPGRPTLRVRGGVPVSATTVSETAAVDNPTRFFVEALRLALLSRGIQITGGEWDIDDLSSKPTAPRRVIATHRSSPLSTLAGYAMKVSQNQYAEIFLRTLGRTDGQTGSVDRGRRAVLNALARWGIPAESIVMKDGSGLSRYNYLTASTIVAVLRQAWKDDTLRGPLIASLPVPAEANSTLARRMRDAVLRPNVQAKTGTLSNVRALSGILRTGSGEPLVFSIVANHYTARTADVDAVVDRALARLVTTTAPAGGRSN